MTFSLSRLTPAARVWTCDVAAANHGFVMPGSGTPPAGRGKPAFSKGSQRNSDHGGGVMCATYDDATELVLLINGHGRQRCSFANGIKSSVFVLPDKVEQSPF